VVATRGTHVAHRPFQCGPRANFKNQKKKKKIKQKTKNIKIKNNDILSLK
jgi:hypothetical protein